MWELARICAGYCLASKTRRESLWVSHTGSQGEKLGVDHSEDKVEPGRTNRNAHGQLGLMRTKRVRTDLLGKLPLPRLMPGTQPRTQEQQGSSGT